MRRASLASLVLVAVGVTACAKTPPPAPPAQPASDLVVLVVNPDDPALGAVIVQAGGATVELREDSSATRVAPGQAPTPPSTLSRDEIQRLFAGALSARPPAPLQFLLYFELGGNELTPESARLVPDIVTAVKSRPAPDVSVIGHTDTTGEAALNARLALDRATLIRDIIVKAGVPPAQIDAVSHGEADLLVATADNVAEARNRRVEVTIR